VAGSLSAKDMPRSSPRFICAEDRRPDRRRPDPAEDFAQYQRAARTSPRATRSARYLRSLGKFRDALPPDTLVLPSHNLPFRGVHRRIDQLAAHHHARLRRDDHRL